MCFKHSTRVFLCGPSFRTMVCHGLSFSSWKANMVVEIIAVKFPFKVDTVQHSFTKECTNHSEAVLC